MVRWVVIVCALALGAPAVFGNDPKPVRLDVLGTPVDVTLPWTLKRAAKPGAAAAHWYGEIGGHDVQCYVWDFPNDKYSVLRPADATSIMAYNYADEDDGDPQFAFQYSKGLPGPFGWAPYGMIATGLLPSADKPKSETYMLGGLVEKGAYAVEVVAEPPLQGAHREAVLAFLRTGVKADCEPWDPKWSKAEVKAMWDVAAPNKKAKKNFRPIRTKHYIVFSNASAGKGFAKHMESLYKSIKKAFPFEEVPGQRLMPVYVFRMPREYYRFYVLATGGPRYSAEQSKGVCYKDFYATWYEAPKDPVHIHEATHQIFENRCGLWGGGSWFQEGCADYMATTPQERKLYRKRGILMPMRKLVTSESLIDETSDDAYIQAATVIEFLRDSKWRPKAFKTFLERMGTVPKNDLTTVNRVLKDVYDTDVDGLEQAWLAWRAKNR